MEMEELFGSLVFTDDEMKKRLTADTYQALKRTMSEGHSLDPQIAEPVAAAMKDWAVEKGVTHYTHWFQPMTGVTAEKHDSFIKPVGDTKVVMEFSGKELIKGESDASSFPSGGLRATFEARGYTAWDPSSYAFIKDNVLCIPTAFYSYNGESLDKKGPLLRSLEVLSDSACRILKLFGTEARRVIPTVGPEQEYFLIDKDLYDLREDLRLCGRTLFGAKSPKGQGLGDHYYAAIVPRVEKYMADLDRELWKLGVFAKTEHNEAAPAQQELAPVYTNASLSTDQNQLTMEMMQKVALRHDLVCLLHEKPFAGVNGSGKHNNWSLSTDAGQNLLEPGDSPNENAQFLLFLTAIISAVDRYQALLRFSVASAGNDLRLGGAEAPPVIMSIYLGNDLEAIVRSIISGGAYDSKTKTEMKIGAHILPRFPKDMTDRNRTSPIAFTGNKFEFRTVGSASSISGPNIVINTIVADTLADYADRLEKTGRRFHTALNELIREELKAHQRVLFSGNGYDSAWTKEAKQRGLLELKTLPDAIRYFDDEESIRLFTRHRIFSEQELHARADIYRASYCNATRIEAMTMIDMTRKQIIPACEAYLNDLARMAKNLAMLSVESDYEKEKIAKLAELIAALGKRTETLEHACARAGEPSLQTTAEYYRDKILPAMARVRETADTLENIVGVEYWPFPVYSDLLFRI